MKNKEKHVEVCKSDLKKIEVENKVCLQLIQPSAAWLAYLVGYQTVMREVGGLRPAQTNTEGLKN